MQISLLLMQQIAQLFLILLMGYAVVKTGLLKAADSRVLSVVFVYLITPCVVLNAFQIENSPEIQSGLLFSVGIAVLAHVVFLALTALLHKPLRLDSVEQVNIIYSNAGALVIPLVQALQGSGYVIYSCGFIIVQLVLLWTHAAALLQGGGKLDAKKILTNVNLIVIVLGALLFAFQVKIPGPLLSTINSVGNMIGPEQVRKVYLPEGFTQFKLEGRGLGSALVLEFLLHYLTKPEYQLHVREEIYLDNMLDLF